jgi:predicted Zn-ribbon and HTH transcriptional regulator
MIKAVVEPKIARMQKCKDCGHEFRPGYYKVCVKCPQCGSERVKCVLFDLLLDMVKY